MEAKDAFVSDLLDDLANNRLTLPTLPEIALKIRRAVDDPCLTGAKLAKLVSTDAALSARLLQVANSVFFRGLNPVENVHTAVVRLGLVCVRNVVTSLVMNQLYQAKKTARVKKQLQTLWLHGAKVAAISNVLARRTAGLDAEEAMLAGLIHDIGALPILSRAASTPEIADDPATLQSIIDEYHPRIGKRILEAWNFPEALVTVAAEHENLAYDSGDKADYTDLVIVANLHSHVGNSERPAVDWSEVGAFEKLDLTPEKSIKILAEAQAEIKEIQRLLVS